MDLTSAMVKAHGRALGADLVGIASMDRFEGAPLQQDPRQIFPAAKAAVVLAFRLPRGYFRGIEEGTYFTAYPAMGYGGLNQIYMPMVLRELCCYIEDFGWEAAAVPNMYPGSSVSFATQAFIPDRSRPVAPGKPHPDVVVDMRIAAYAAGMGEFGWSKMFLTPEFSPRQRFCLLLTDAELEPDPIFQGKICDRGKRCVAECSIAYRGGKAETNPFMRSGAREEDYAGTYCGRPKLDDLCGYPKLFNHNPAIEGARGGIRACVIHLEEKKRTSNTFANPFRRGKPWRMSAAGADGRNNEERPVDGAE